MARLRAAEEACTGLFSDVQGIALYDHTGDIPAELGIARPTRPPLLLLPGLSGGNPRRATREALDRLRPAAIAICGYATPDARECLRWARRHGARAILMTETRESDGKRVWWKETFKSRIVLRYHGALCGGDSARTYLEKLGMKPDRIVVGYDVVDDGYFFERTQDFKTQDTRAEGGERESGDRGQESGGRGQEPSTTNKAQSTAALPPPYFLASNRFIQRKNMAGLIDAYAAYVKAAQLDKVSDGQRPPLHVWNLVLLGDGELKPSRIAQCQRLGLQVIESAPWDADLTPVSCPLTSGLVFFPGFRQIDELPRFYAHAGAFVHPALSEPWGLVLNEAMASGLPVLSSENVGAAEELIDEGVNGWVFEASNVEEMAGELIRMAALTSAARAEMGKASRRILGERFPTREFGEGLAKLLGP
ncbi:MAG: glycosyltransferase [Verrucomicrobiales bacterium]